MGVIESRKLDRLLERRGQKKLTDPSAVCAPQVCVCALSSCTASWAKQSVCTTSVCTTRFSSATAPTFHKKCIQHTGHTCMRSTAIPTLPTHGMEPPTRPQPGLGLAPLVRPELVEQPRTDNNPLIRPGNITEKHSSVYRAGMTGSALLLVNNRLENRSTVHQWDDEMLGPARDKTGFE